MQGKTVLKKLLSRVTMHQMRPIFYLLVCNFLWLIVQGFDCPYAICDCSGSDINCEDRGLNTVPPLLVDKNTFFTFLLLDNNLITAIQSQSLSANLTSITLRSNPLTSIDSTAFDELANSLQSLSLSEVNFNRISDAFTKLRALTDLTIFNSKIQDWNDDAMKNIGGTLHSLALQNVGFTSWPRWMQYFSQLKELIITDSSISVLPDDALDKLSNILTTLNLNNNRLTEVPKTLSKLNALTILILDQNEIVDVTWLPQSSKLTLLSLNHNNVPDGHQLANALLPFADSLFDLDLNSNKLSIIPNISFLTQVGSLNLTRNLISDPNSGSLPSAMYELDLGFNSLISIPHVMKTLNSLTVMFLPSNAIREIRGVDITPWTSSLELGFNLIKELTDTSFPQDSKILFLRLNNNPLDTISPLAFRNLPMLAELSLENTKLTRLPLALASLKGTVMLEMSGTSGLVCTCLEKSLESWILSQSSGNIIGYCGLLSIYEFFQALSPFCPV